MTQRAGHAKVKFFSLGQPQRMAKSGSKTRIWLLKLVPYTVELVPKPSKVGTGARTCSDAKFYTFNKIAYLFELPTA
jgi:hypothetical protein